VSKFSNASDIPTGLRSFATRYLPGLVLCVAVSLVGIAAQAAEMRWFGHPYVEALVVAILAGTAIRTFWEPSTRWQAGIALGAKQLLEVAIMLLGASLSFSTIAASGLILVVLIVAIVFAMIGVSFMIGRALELPVRLSILIACGNSICGNSAIAAVAPVIGASSDDVASSIAFTAVLGVLMVLGLPLLIPLMELSAAQYGVLAGLTVYAVPQVLAATVPAGLVSTQVGTLVKLIRVLMLGPVVLALSFVSWRYDLTSRQGSGTQIDLHRLVPWFIPGFLVLATLRSAGFLPADWSSSIADVTTVLTIISMAALGLGVDLRTIAKVGMRVTAAVSLSLLVLLGISSVVVRFL